ncbi:DUF1054 family protein [Leuconostoc carnosum]|uniref:DUF1054 family protein n=1 Tax=Leuconostoc carnosum TaxID=1252 RepID=UPI00345D2700
MFEASDFEIFDEQTLAGRMALIRDVIDPKFEQFAEIALPILNQDGQSWFAHIAKHLRRTTYAPDNTWVAFAPNKRGYKMMPHFELGIWADHIYLYLAVEENMKPKQTAPIVSKLNDVSPMIANLPEQFVISQDHMVNQNVPLSAYEATVSRFENVKHSEVLIGIKIMRGDAYLGTSAVTEKLISALKTLLPIYEKLK